MEKIRSMLSIQASSFRFEHLLILLAIAWHSQLSAEGSTKLYKWIDEKGEIFYSDKLPAEASKHERAILNKEGMTVQKVDRAKTKEEIAAEKRIIEAQKRAEEAARMQAIEDKRLLNTYTTIEDIDKARDDRLATIDSEIRLAETRINKHSLRREDLRKQAAQFERQGKPIPERVTTRIDELNDTIAEQESFIEKKEGEKIDVEANFALDKKHYVEARNRLNKKESN